MNINIDTKPTTFDDLIARYDECIVAIRFAIDSESPIADLVVTVQKPGEHQQAMTYVYFNEAWHLQSLAIDSTKYIRKDSALIKRTIDTISAINKVLPRMK